MTTHPWPEHTFTVLTGLQDSEAVLTPLLLRGQPLPTSVPTLKELTQRVSRLMATNHETTARVLGVSRSTASKNEPVNPDVLDRIHSLSQNLDRAQAVFGDDAVGWFTAPNPALGNLSPLELHQTRYGERHVTEFITGMLDGTFL
ncbi:hypothetical protein GCM10008955_41260 [Deinococcus malanensis]|uniref:Antitoxin Xre/MbcA/ParS-like toxin-binding domain-containing protein n=1 Tax=Deinococcus malanensis TaxID=1706855 RepID=A0ABQ2F3D4_9DEIO|nr:antitoxin Xre/MbcA/ParS toxin-binding domain-containing protein [Deinococcus malanensis]GGK43255.1 hypothetical protein GCM10008955_41260 [Deinococcus malanensis]